MIWYWIQIMQKSFHEKAQVKCLAYLFIIILVIFNDFWEHEYIAEYFFLTFLFPILICV